jgi:hypothetical protein
MNIFTGYTKQKPAIYNQSNNSIDYMSSSNSMYNSHKKNKQIINSQEYPSYNNRNNQRNPNYINNTSQTNPNYINNTSQTNPNYINNTIKQNIIDYIYTNINLSELKYHILEYTSDLDLLKEHTHYISANFSGLNYLLVFLKIQDTNHTYLVDRKTLCYNKKQLNINLVKMITVSIKLEQNIYNGTIFDGIIYNNNKSFIITDVYTMRGKNMLLDRLNHKINNVVSYLTDKMKDDKTNNLKLSVNKLYELSDIKTLLQDIKKIQTHNIRGIAFYPEISGTKLIYMLDNLDRNINTTKSPDTDNTNAHNQTYKPKTQIRYVCKNKNDIYATFELRQTKNIDVYKLYLLETKIKNDKKIMIGKNMGIAYIPTIECSQMCINLFTNPNKNIFMRCKFVRDINKWMPIEQDNNASRPTNITELEDLINVIEDADSEQEND